MAANFVPRAVFPTLSSLPRSYFLGHHAAALTKMKRLLASTDLIIECRDYRVPLTSRNPLLEDQLAGRERLVVYTKRDLAEPDIRRERIIRQWHAPSSVLFVNHAERKDVRRVVRFAEDFARQATSLTGSHMMVVGMPNVGKSSLLNALRAVSLGKGKAAQTGAQPGVTRKIATGVKIIEDGDDHSSVYLLDTPGVFIPYVPDAEAMLKLALCGCVKDSIILPTSLADYCLYRINLVSPKLYSEYHTPTNDIMLLLDAMARKTGRLQKGGVPDTESIAIWMIQRWRSGHLGRFILDEVTEEALQIRRDEENAAIPSMNQVRKMAKEVTRAKAKSRSVSAV
jgi:mitochondrial GTPase 1